MASQLDCLSANHHTRHRWRYEDDGGLTPQPTGQPPRGNLLIALLLIGGSIAGLVYLLNSLQPR